MNRKKIVRAIIELCLQWWQETRKRGMLRAGAKVLNEPGAERWKEDNEETDHESGEKQENTDTNPIPEPTIHANEN